MVTEMAGFFGAPCLLPHCDAHLALHLRAHPGELAERVPAGAGGEPPGMFKYRRVCSWLLAAGCWQLAADGAGRCSAEQQLLECLEVKRARRGLEQP